jgi:hypothetical protein
MTSLKHIGRLKNNKRRAIIAYRTVPDAPTYALVVLTESLPADEHDTLMRLVESSTGQLAHELADAMYRTVMPDGRNMLAALHATGQLRKVATNEIEMTPDTHTSIGLDELNEIIAQQKGVAIEDLAIKPIISEEVKQAAEKKKLQDDADLAAMQATSDDPIVHAMNLAIGEKNPGLLAEVDPVKMVEAAPEVSNAELAAQLRDHADQMVKTAEMLRKQAETVSPNVIKAAPTKRRAPAVKKPVAKKATSA